MIRKKFLFWLELKSTLEWKWSELKGRRRCVVLLREKRERKCRARADPSNVLFVLGSGFDDDEVAEEDEYENRMLLLLAFLSPILAVSPNFRLTARERERERSR